MNILCLRLVLYPKSECYEQVRMESEMGVGVYHSAGDLAGGIVDASLKINVEFQCFFRIIPFLCIEKWA